MEFKIEGAKHKKMTSFIMMFRVNMVHVVRLTTLLQMVRVMRSSMLRMVRVMVHMAVVEMVRVLPRMVSLQLHNLLRLPFHVKELLLDHFDFHILSHLLGSHILQQLMIGQSQGLITRARLTCGMVIFSTLDL